MIGSGYFKKKSLGIRMLGTLICLLIYRLLCCIPLPFTNVRLFYNGLSTGDSFSMLNLLTGGALSRVSIAGLGISPYITASIFVQIFGIIIPSIAELQRSGAVGRKRIKHLTIALSVITGLMSSIGILNMYMTYGVFTKTTFVVKALCVLIMTLCGVFFAVLGEFIEDELFGNGTSLLLLTGILCNVPREMANVVQTLRLQGDVFSVLAKLGGIAFVLVAMLVFVVWMNETEKDVPLVYSGKSVSDAQLVRENSVLPLKMLPNSVLPVIFASSLMSVVTILRSVFGASPDSLFRLFDMNTWLNSKDIIASFGIPIYFAFIFLFGYYTQLVNMNPIEMAANLKRAGAVIPGITPGLDTEDYLRVHSDKMNRMGCIGLCIVAFAPILLGRLFHVSSLSFIGTSLIIIVSVVSDAWYTWRVENRSAYYMSSIRDLGKTAYQKRKNAFALFTRLEVR